MTDLPAPLVPADVRAQREAELWRAYEHARDDLIEGVRRGVWNIEQVHRCSETFRRWEVAFNS